MPHCPKGNRFSELKHKMLQGKRDTMFSFTFRLIPRKILITFCTEHVGLEMYHVGPACNHAFSIYFCICSPTVHSWTLALTIYPSSNEPSRQQLDHPSGSKACIALNTKILNHIYKQGNGLISHTHSIITIQPNHLTHSIITIQPSHLTAVILKSWQKLN